MATNETMEIDIIVDGKPAVRGIEKVEKSTKQLETTTLSVNKRMKASWVEVGIAGAVVVATLKKMVDTGFQYNSAMEKQTNGISSLITATSEMVDSQGNALTMQDLLNQSQNEAIGIVTRLNEINAETPHTLEQTSQIFKSMLPSLRSLGASYEDVIGVTKQLSIASGAAGIEFNSLLAGVDGLATGTVLANSDLGRFLSTIGLTNKDLKSSTDIVGLLNDKLKGFKSFDTMDVSVSNFTVTWNKLVGAITSDAFSNAKTSLNEFSDIMNGVFEGFERARVLEGDIFELKNKDEINQRLMSNLMLQGDLNKKLEEYGGISRTFQSNKIKADKESLASLKAEEESLISLFEIFMETNSAKTVAKIKSKEDSKEEIGLLEDQLKLLKDGRDIYSDMFQESADTFTELIDNAHELVEEYSDLNNEGTIYEEHMKLLNTALEANIITQEQYNDTVENMGIAYANATDMGKESLTGLEMQMASLQQTIGGQLENAMTDTFRSWMDGAMDFGDLMENLIKDIAAEMIRVFVIQQALYGAGGSSSNITGGIMGALTSANGNVFNEGQHVTAFADGGAFTNSVVSSPTLAPMALFGEAGPEAIMPLTRGSNGKLGVETSGSGGGDVIVNIVNNSSADVSAQQDGDTLNVVIEATQNAIATGIRRNTSPVSDALQSTYNLRR